MMIEDQELRDVFKVASQEHLQKLDDGLLYLEQHPSDLAKLEQLLRETHSLKGDAGMLGVKNVASLAHQMEHILGSVKRGETQLNSDISDRLSQGLDAIRQLVNEAVTGEDSGINTFYILASMMGASSQLQPQAAASIVDSSSSQVPEQPLVEPQFTEPPTQQPETNVENSEVVNLEKNSSFLPLQSQPEFPLQAQNLPAPSDSAPASASQSAVTASSTSSYRIETIRVATQNLDDLMTQAGELTVTKTRLGHRVAEIEKITTLWEEWSREYFVTSLTVDRMQIDENGIKTNEEGVCFKVQIGAYTKQVPADVAAKFSSIKTWPVENKQSNSLYIYNIGNFSELRFAKQLKEEALKLGIADAFITVYRDGKKLYGTEAAELMNR